MVVSLWGLAGAVQGADMSNYFREESLAYCGIASFEEAKETSCSWDPAALATGDCLNPKYEFVVGRQVVFKSCKSIGILSFWQPMPASPPSQAPASDTQVWRLLRALQPLAKDAIGAPEPACIKNLKPYAERKAKANHEDFFNCFEQWDKDRVQRWQQSQTGAILRAIQPALEKANLSSPQTIAAIGALTLLVEDSGISVLPIEVESLLKQFQ
jgi:hypothetical protein